MSLNAVPNTHAPSVCDALWFRDGNVVLQAGSLIFKVLQSILNRESPIFRDMFALPQPPQADSTETFDGCPPMRLSDTEEDIRLFLSVIFDGNFLEELPSKREHVVLLGIAAKYQATRVLRRVMASLSHDYPDTLEAYDHWISETEEDSCLAASRNCGTYVRMADIFPLFEVARKSGMHILLPAAYVILIGLRQASDEVLADWTNHGLLPEDAFSIVTAKRKLDTLCRAHILYTLYGPHRDISEFCITPLPCHHTRHEILSLVTKESGMIELPFQDVREYAKDQISRLCQNCEPHFTEVYEDRRRSGWEKLPSILGLGSWAELRAARAELLGEHA